MASVPMIALRLIWRTTGRRLLSETMSPSR
jgi:hypothetical protein